MQIETITLGGDAPGRQHTLTLLRYGTADGRPGAYIQAGLHADEAPGMLCAVHLRRRLEELERTGDILGQITLVPAANPLGMGQSLLGSHHGRFDLSDGSNFNRDFPALADDAAMVLASRLGDDASTNGLLVRTALLAALAGRRPRRPADSLKAHLLKAALEARTVLDLHCDGEATVHLYTLTGQDEAFAPLATWLGARVVLVSSQSGGDPFDEAVTRPWAEIRRRFADHPVPEGPIAATVELRGEADVDHATASADADAVIQFLAVRGHLAMEPSALPAPLYSPTPLEACEALEAPASGLIVFRRAIGDTVTAGDLIAEIVDPIDGSAHAVRATTDGVFFARTAARFAFAGRRLGKIAGTVPFRTGPLLSP